MCAVRFESGFFLLHCKLAFLAWRMTVMFGRDLCKGRAIGGRKGKVEEILGDVGVVWGIGDPGDIYLGPHASTLMSRCTCVAY